MMKQPKSMMVVIDINKFYKSSNYSCNNMMKLNDLAQQFKAKFHTARLLKFDPYVLKNTIVAWPKKYPNYLFYKHKFPQPYLPHH